MEKTITYCDLCGKPDAHQFSFAVDSERDGAGEIDTIHARVDLCFVCCAAQLELFICALPWPARQKLHEGIVKRKSLYLTHMSRAEKRNGLAEPAA